MGIATSQRLAGYVILQQCRFVWSDSFIGPGNGGNQFIGKTLVTADFQQPAVNLET
jgi:hypothetical protein